VLLEVLHKGLLRSHRRAHSSKIIRANGNPIISWVQGGVVIQALTRGQGKEVGRHYLCRVLIDLRMTMIVRSDL
jgi:hypothetical protein